MKKSKEIILNDFLPYRLSVTSNAVSSLIARAYEERFQLSIPEWRAMAILAERGEATPREISRTACMDKISVTRATKRLQQRKLVSSRENAADGRSHLLSLTEEGGRLYEQVVPLALAFEADLIQQFSAKEITLLENLLRRLQEKAMEHSAPSKE